MSEKEIPENFCALPFIQLQMQPTGNVSPCCWNQSVVLGNVKDQELLAIWNSEKLQELRREFLSGDIKMCAQQVRHIQCHKYSWHLMPHADLSVVQSGPPRRLDFRLNGKCNLQCVMCEVWTQPNGLYDECGFWQRGPKEIFPYLVEADVLGGEPFVQKDTFRLIDEVSKVNSTCSWAFVTNGQWKFAAPIRSRLDQIRIRWLQVSVDSIVPETYSKIRTGGKLERCLETVDALVAYRSERQTQNRDFRFVISMCVQPMNFSEIRDFIKYALDRDIQPALQFLYEPSELSLLSRPEGERRRMVEELQSLPFLMHEFTHSILLPLQDSLPKSPDLLELSSSVV